jgi:flavin reductase (DIM6/NTAB) family NADH-FMN oxidoreductase RutF
MARTPFDALVADLDTAMIVVTAATADDRDGCLVGFHCQCSIEPKRYAVWLSVENRTQRVAMQADVLAVHCLAADQHDLAAVFGGETGDEVDKLAGVQWTPGPGGVPLLDDVAHRFVGRIVSRHELDGDHVLFELEPIEASHPSTLDPYRFHQASDIEPGHPA